MFRPFDTFRAVAQSADESRLVYPLYLASSTWRRRGWFTRNLTHQKLRNITKAARAFTTKARTTNSLPVGVKIDITPLCNLHCTVCVHAVPDGRPALEVQHFQPTDKMSIDTFAHIIDQIRDHSSAVSLYYLGDPLMHPDLPELCRIAADAELNVHVSTNFSFKLPDQKLEALLTSGLTHLTVCIDGLTQDTSSARH